jgi:chloramphenicol O-acetyltransferase type A
MDEPLDTATWTRREAFEHFRSFEQPFFNVCTRVDVAPLKAAVHARGVGSLALAYHFLALRLVNEQAAFRLRLAAMPGRAGSAGDSGAVGVVRHATVHGSFGFAHLEHVAGWRQFAHDAAASMAATRTRAEVFNPRPGDTAVAYFTTLPWVHFSSFAHARRSDPMDSIPRFAFGRIDPDGASVGARHWMPVSVEVHHALMDGLHVGQWVQAFEAALADPAPWLAA